MLAESDLREPINAGSDMLLQIILWREVYL